MIIVNKKWNKNINELTNPIEIQTKIVLSHPVSAAIVSGLLISAFFYKAFIPVVAEFHIFLILFTTVYLLPKLTNKRFGLFLLLIFVVYLIHTFEAYLGVKSTKIRWLLVLDAMVLIIALFLAKQAAAIFQEELMVNILPRGVAPAISLILRILLVGVGLYMALSAAGLDLSKLGFMLGALGVGIGFGLQNVVLNFVAGLILAFERPINLGDTIEIDQEFGVVTSIGVRSSNIKSYSGYEVIIPNGDLISKKVINYTLTNRDRRSKILMKTSPNADPEMIIDLFNKIANENPMTKKDPAPKTYFYGYDPEGNLSFALLYWTTFSDTLKTDSAIALKIFSKLKEEGIEPPAPLRRIVGNK